jgi:hypothetical protein
MTRRSNSSCQRPIEASRSCANTHAVASIASGLYGEHHLTSNLWVDADFGLEEHLKVYMWPFIITREGRQKEPRDTTKMHYMII